MSYKTLLVRCAVESAGAKAVQCAHAEQQKSGAGTNLNRHLRLAGSFRAPAVADAVDWRLLRLPSAGSSAAFGFFCRFGCGFAAGFLCCRFRCFFRGSSSGSSAFSSEAAASVSGGFASLLLPPPSPGSAAAAASSCFSTPCTSAQLLFLVDCELAIC